MLDVPDPKVFICLIFNNKDILFAMIDGKKS